MGTATILGKTYQTVAMPDGRTWLAENLDYDAGADSKYYNNDQATYGEYGKLYRLGYAKTFSSGLWSVPTDSEWSTLISVCGGVIAGKNLKESGTAHWGAPNSGVDLYGFSAFGGGAFIGGSFGLILSAGIFARLNSNSTVILDKSYDQVFGDSFGDNDYVSIRLIYTPPASLNHGFISSSDYVDLISSPERGYEPTITPSLEWTRLPSGLYRCLDDGAAYDVHDAEITVYVTGAVLSAWETFYKASKAETVTYYAPDGVLPFGPHIPVGSTGASVKITGWKNGGKVGITADLWKLTLSMRLMQGYTPTLPAGVPALFGKKYATPSWDVASVVHLTDDGRASVTARSPEAQTCQVVADNFDASTAASIINWALYTRGSSFTYSPPSGLYPFGPSLGNGPFTVRLIDWTVQKPNPRRWDFTFTLARE